MRYYCIKQHDITDCGVACLATICKQNGYKIDITQICEVAGTDKIAGDNASYVIPVGIANNVTQLHQFLFAEENYVPSEIVQSISDEVSELSGIYPENE